MGGMCSQWPLGRSRLSASVGDSSAHPQQVFASGEGAGERLAYPVHV